MIRVALVDDEPLVRAGLRTILESDPQIEVVAEAGSGAGAVDVADRHRPDVLLLDIQMPGGDGLTAAETLRERHPGVRVVIVTTFDEDRYIARALDAGVDGFLLKSSDPYPDRMVGGTLRNRMRNTPAANNVHAKTGSLTGASALSGYVTDADGERLVFSIIFNNYLSGAPTDLQDKIAILLATFSRHPTAATLRSAVPSVPVASGSDLGWRKD
jgi:CheY-like chemotaxis protein